MKLVGAGRRLPIYLIADTSLSMKGAPIEAVNVGLRNFTAALQNDPYALECAAVSVIAFSEGADQLTPLQEAGEFSPPTLSAEGESTELGKALRKLAEVLDKDIRVRTSEFLGDWRPMIFLMTDAVPTDAWESALPVYRKAMDKWKGAMVAIACGEEVDLSVLSALTEDVLLMPDMTPEVFARLFKWISQSVTSASQRVKNSSQEDTRPASILGQLGPLPKGITKHG